MMSLHLLIINVIRKQDLTRKIVDFSERERESGVYKIETDLAASV